jgi:hypothetical protein
MSVEDTPKTSAWQALEVGRTPMAIRNRGELGGFSNVAAPAMAATIRRSNEQDIQNIRSILECRQAETGTRNSS